MSAAEKLKALDKAASSGPWAASEGGIYESHGWGVDGPDWHYDAELTEGDSRLIALLRNALPQIVAVVEAAEKYPPPTYSLKHEMAAALAALDDALSPPTGGSA